MPAGYMQIAGSELPSSTSGNWSFNGFSSTYTDLRFTFTGRMDSGTTVLRVRFNSDTGTNYSWCIMGGYGVGSASTTCQTTRNEISCNYYTNFSPEPCTFDINIFDYASTSKFKTVLINSSTKQYASSVGGVETVMGVWRSTAAITDINISTSTGTFYGAYNLVGIDEA